MDITLKRLEEEEILAFYRAEMKKVRQEKDYREECFLSEVCIAGLVAKGYYKAYALSEGRKKIGFCLLISDHRDRIFLLHHFYIFKKYRGYNYSEILFELLVKLINHENKERLEPALGIFIEVEGVQDLEEEGFLRREKELRFYRGLGAYMTDILPSFSKEYNVMFLPIFKKLTRIELKQELLSIYKNILPSFKDNKKFIKRLTEDV